MVTSNSKRASLKSGSGRAPQKQDSGKGTLEFYVTSGPGAEGALRDELSELGFRSVRLNRGGIPFFGDWEDGWRACLQSRIGQRVMVVLGRYPAQDQDELYQGAKALDWGEYLTRNQTFAVAAFVHESCGVANNLAALRVKDAIVDRLREETGARPDVHRDDPDVRVFLYWTRGRATVYLDLSGVPLFKRGYRQSGGEAPLKETLAAAVLRLSGWDRKIPLVDPMCGSGTLVIEAALWACQVPPGIWRERFGFERWANFGDKEAERLGRLRGELRGLVHGHPPRITGFDLDETALESARANARAAGLRLSFRRMPLRELQADGQRRLLISNPPYGVRLDTDHQLYQELGAAVRRLQGWRVCLLTGNPQLTKYIPIRPLAEHPLKNGNIDCRLLVYEC
ncbi:MAG TPA: THUMP domain-containing protein [Lentisphaeria bacterium]|nr:THUMP domain-containing protein [Lentisphaeria bacterium]